jgi:anti-sigma factor RsiW
MTCQDVIELVEPIAAGEHEVTDSLRDHFESCPRCAAALATARRIETALQRHETPPAPARFTSLVVSRVRSDRWRVEQRVDQVFNLAIVAAVLLLAGGVAALTNLSSVAAAAFQGSAIFIGAAEDIVQRSAPLAGAYVAAAGLLVSAVVMWWWAERRLSL